MRAAPGPRLAPRLLRTVVVGPRLRQKVLGPFVGLAATVAAAATGTTGTRLEHVVVREGPTPGVELRLSGVVEPHAHRVAAPPRVYLDLPNTTLGAGVARVSDGAAVVRRVRAGQFDPKTARVVVELDRARAFEVHRDGAAIVVTFAATPAAAKPAAADAAPTAPSAPAAVHAPPASEAAPPAPTPRIDAAAPAPAPLGRTDQPLAPASPRASTRPVELQERIARRYAEDDWAGIVVLYRDNLEVVRRDADATTRAAVVDALRELGLVYSARKLLGPSAAGEAPALRLVRGGMALDAGDVGAAKACLVGLDEAAIDPALVPPLRRLQVRIALADGDLDAAADAIGTRAAPELRAELARAALEAGRIASARRACARAVVAFRHALDADGGRTARAAAGAGLVQAARACENPEETMAGLGVLAESTHPLLRRAAAALAAMRVEENRQAAATARDDGGG